VSFGGDNYVVVWQEGTFGASDIWAQRIDTAGARRDGSFQLSAATGDQANAAVAFDGTNHLVAWDDRRNGGADVFATRLGTTGGPIDTAGLPISTTSGNQELPTVAFNGSFLVAWRDRRSGSQFDVYAARVTTGGSVQDANGFAIAATPAGESQPALAPAGGNEWNATYERATPGGSAVFHRLVAPK
jgi:hypothetical protein